MLPSHLKMTSPAQFKRTMRRGSKAGSRTVVVHYWCPFLGGVQQRDALTTSADQVALSAAPRCGLVVSKAVGNAVVRHRVSRRLRHVLASLIADGTIPDQAHVVVRALPAAAEATSHKLLRDVTSALGHAADKASRSVKHVR